MNGLAGAVFTVFARLAVSSAAEARAAWRRRVYSPRATRAAGEALFAFAVAWFLLFGPPVHRASRAARHLR